MVSVRNGPSNGELGGSRDKGRFLCDCAACGCVRRAVAAVTAVIHTVSGAAPTGSTATSYRLSSAPVHRWQLQPCRGEECLLHLSYVAVCCESGGGRKRDASVRESPCEWSHCGWLRARLILVVLSLRSCVVLVLERAARTVPAPRCVFANHYLLTLACSAAARCRHQLVAAIAGACRCCTIVQRRARRSMEDTRYRQQRHQARLTAEAPQPHVQLVKTAVHPVRLTHISSAPIQHTAFYCLTY